MPEPVADPSADPAHERVVNPAGGTSSVHGVRPEALNGLLASYEAEPRMRHIDAAFLPSRARVIDLIELLRRVTFPGFFEDERLATDNLRDRTAALLEETEALLFDQVRQALRYALNRAADAEHAAAVGAEPIDLAASGHDAHAHKPGDDCDDCDQDARAITDAVLAGVPAVRDLLATDVQAAFDGDPAGANTDETIFCYPGIDAVFTHRYAHALHALGVPLIPRIMSEYAHNETGVDIHPGATIGPSFFIDHGTGVVVGETCTIGERVKIYQGVTLGALSTKGGRNWRGRKRHPTIEDDVTIYGGAVILGGQTVIGKGATIGGAVFLTSSVLPGHTVTTGAPDPTHRPPKQRRRKTDLPTPDPGATA
ncbi:MAG: serine acetyltransferase [Planctomycetota bacterium]